MAIIKCKMCGGDLNIIEGASTAECEFCGSVQTVPKVDDEKKLTLFARANRLRAACEFDKAAGIYEAIVADFPEEAEAYWGLVLCKYGIEYVDDPATGKKIPTCHRSSFEAIMEDSDFEQAMENADIMARKVYREESKAIEEIRKGIISVSSSEQPYDIFICYKETDENGDRTLDSVLAQDVYDALTDKGYRVFFSRITLEDKLGMEYEPYIFAALNSAKIMLAFGTDYEYFNAVWVKNEWSRYLKLMAKDKDKYLIPCYKGIDAYDMPKEFAKLQAQDLGKVGAIQDLLRGIEKIVPQQKEGTATKKTATAQQISTQRNPTVDSYLERAFMFLEDGDWDSAIAYCEKVLDIEPKNAKAYLGKLMADLNVSKQENLINEEKSFKNNKNYQKAIQYSDENLKRTLSSYIKHITSVNCQKLLRVRREIQPVQSLLAAGECHTVGLQADGTVVSVGDNSRGQCNVEDWQNIVAVAAGWYHTVGLKEDGTVVSVGDNSRGQCNVEDWQNIVAVAAKFYHTVGLQADGTVVSVGDNSCGQCNVEDWQNIVAVAAGCCHTVGLKADGTVVSVGDNSCGQCNVEDWQNIVAVAAGECHTVGLKEDGTVIAVGANDYGQCNIEDWQNIVAVAAYLGETVGLKADGTIVCEECNVSKIKNSVAVAAGPVFAMALQENGTVVPLLYSISDEEDLALRNPSAWKLFINYKQFETERANAYKQAKKRCIARTELILVLKRILEKKRIAEAKTAEERRAAEAKAAQERRIAEAKAAEERRIAEAKARQEAAQRAAWRAAGLCQYCGGQLKGLFGKKCVSCGKPKDY